MNYQILLFVEILIFGQLIKGKQVNQSNPDMLLEVNEFKSGFVYMEAHLWNSRESMLQPTWYSYGKVSNNNETRTLQLFTHSATSPSTAIIKATFHPDHQDISLDGTTYSKLVPYQSRGSDQSPTSQTGSYDDNGTTSNLLAITKPYETPRTGQKDMPQHIMHKHPLTGFWMDPSQPEGFRSISVSAKNNVLVHGRDHKMAELWSARGKTEGSGEIEVDFDTVFNHEGKLKGMYDINNDPDKITWDDNTYWIKIST